MVDSSPHPFPRDRRVVFARVHAITGVAIRPEEQTPDVRQAFGRLLAQMDLDRLTHLPLLGHFKDKLRDILRERKDQPETDKIPLTVVFCDFNYLKKANDFLGQEVTNILIKDIVTMLQNDTRQNNYGGKGNIYARNNGTERSPTNAIRQADVIARHGGDEFIILLHGCDQAAAKRKMADIAHKIVRRTFSYGSPNFPFGQRDIKHAEISYGCYQIPPLNELQKRMPDLEIAVTNAIHAADSRMKEYKSLHRHQPTFIHNGTTIWSQQLADSHATATMPPLGEDIWQVIVLEGQKKAKNASHTIH